MTESFENVNHLVLNFYSDGYSIAVKLNEFPVFTSETILETARISYEETSLLDYIENEELPPLLVDMIEKSPKLSRYKIWHNGCLVLEVRDKINNNHDINYNNNSSNLSSHESYFILLRPTNLSMLNDVMNLTSNQSWSTQDKLQLESQIVLHNSPPLSLEPDASTHCPDMKVTSNNNAHTRHKKKLPHTKLYSIKSGLGFSNLPPELNLQQFLATKRAKKTLAMGHLVRFQRFKKNLNRH